VTDGQEAVVRGWFERGETCNHHAQILNIARGSRGFPAPVTWRVIGDIFGLSGSTVEKYAGQSRWMGESVGRLPVLTDTDLNKTRINTK
jgi:hypothetical protein